MIFPLRDTLPSRHRPVMTMTLIAFTSLVYLFEATQSTRALEELVYLFGIVPARFSHPGWAATVGFPVDTYWPFLTSIFLHAGFLHLAGNMWFLWIFGDNVEDRMGPLRFLLFYLVMGVAAGLVHWLTNSHSTVPTVGASGAIAGVLGAYVVMFPRSRVITLVLLVFWPIFIDIPAMVYLLFWFVAQLFSGTVSLLGPGQVGGVAWWAHVGGFVAGAASYRLFLSREPAWKWDADE